MPATPIASSTSSSMETTRAKSSSDLCPSSDMLNCCRGSPATKWLHASLLVSQLAFAGFEIISKATVVHSVGIFAFSCYRNCLATILIAMAAYFFEHRYWHKLTTRRICCLFLLSLMGVTMNQVLYLAGLRYTSAVFASASRNITPVFTFMLAWICKLEAVNIRKQDGIAKVLGCVCGILGSIFLSIYRGPVAIRSSFSVINSPSHDTTSNSTVHLNLFHATVAAHVLGPIYLVSSCAAFAVFLVLQAKLLKAFPAPISCAALMCFFSVLQLLLGSLVFDQGWANWKLTKAEAVSITYSGLVVSGFVSSVQSWGTCVSGPVIVSAYQPLETVLTAILGFFLLKETLFTGSIVGGFIVIVGLYLLVWGQAQERRLCMQRQRQMTQEPPEQTSTPCTTRQVEC